MITSKKAIKLGSSNTHKFNGKDMNGVQSLSQQDEPNDEDR